MNKNQNEGKDIPVDFIEESMKKNIEEISSESEVNEKKKTAKTKQEKYSHKKKLENYKSKYEELNEQFLRFRAEFANYKKRVQRDQIEFAGYLKGEFLKRMLPVLDDFNHMIEKSGEGSNEKTILEGAKMIYNKLYRILVAEGLEKIEAMDKEFDPQIHEAMMMQKITNPENHNKIISVFQDGYKIKDRLLRPSKVVVGNFEETEDKN